MPPARARMRHRRPSRKWRWSASRRARRRAPPSRCRRSRRLPGAGIGSSTNRAAISAIAVVHEELKIPYYYGIDKLCTLATNNIEELLSLAATLYEGLQAKQIMRKPELLLSPTEQEKLIKDVAKRKREFIPKSHTEGTRAQRLLDAIGAYCRDRTFLPNAPYAPGVTGVRLSRPELARLKGKLTGVDEKRTILLRLLAECVAENLLMSRESSASTSRDGGTVFYLNRTLCAHFDLPLQTGGWQDVTADTMIEWMELGPQPSRRRRLELK